MSETIDFSTLSPLIATPEMPELGPGPRPDVQPLAALNHQVDHVLARAPLPAMSRDLIRATILLWHDHLDAAHTIAQAIENEDGSYVHGIVHRREPDYSNARYWFHRVGQHRSSPKLAAKVETLLASAQGRGLGAKLIPRGAWAPCAFIDACENAAGRAASDDQVQLLRAIQKAEFEILLEHFCQSKD